MERQGPGILSDGRRAVISENGRSTPRLQTGSEARKIEEEQSSQVFSGLIWFGQKGQKKKMRATTEMNGARQA